MHTQELATIRAGWRCACAALMGEHVLDVASVDLDQELARLGEGIKGEVEGLRAKLGAVRAQQAPWEAQLAAVKGRICVAAAERDLLLRKQADAAQRLQARACRHQTKIVAKQRMQAPQGISALLSLHPYCANCLGLGTCLLRRIALKAKTA